MAMTDEAKENMKQGQRAMNAVDAYLDFINTEKPRGRKPDPAKIQEKIDAEPKLAKKLILISQLEEARRRDELVEEEAKLEAEFVKYAAWFTEQHSILYAAWRTMGVQAGVLEKAGIKSP